MRRWKAFLAGTLALVLALAPAAPAFACSAYDDLIRRAALRYSVPDWLIKGVIAAESGFRADAYRPEPQVGDAAHGLMQVLLSTARELGYRGSASGLMDPETNIDLGTRYLAAMLERFGGDHELAVAAYNAGPGRVGRLVETYGTRYAAIRPHLSAAAQDHVARVMTYAGQFRAGQTGGFLCPAGETPRSTAGSVQPLLVALILALFVALANQ